MYLSVRLLCAAIILFVINIYPQSPGDTLWTRLYGGDAYDEANGVVNAQDSGYIFVGTTQSYGVGRWSNAFIGKTSPNGDSLFTVNFGGPGMDVLTDVIQTSDGNYLTIGLSDSDTLFEQAFIVKFNDKGDTLWTKTYGGRGKEIAYSVLETEDNGFIISAITGVPGNEDFWIIRTDMNGDTLWTKTYATPGNDAAYSICRTSDSSYVLTGLMNNQSLSVMKIDQQGDSLWTKTFGGQQFDEGVSVIEASDKNLMVVGHTSSTGAGELDISLLRLTPKGDLIYQKTYGSSAYEEGEDIIELKENEFIIAGNTTKNSSSGTMDYYIICIDSSGTQKWSKIMGTEFPDRCYDLFDTHDGNFLIAGSDSKSGQLEDAALTMMSGGVPTGVNEESPLNTFVLYDAYPNPFNPSTCIKYSVPSVSHVSIKIFGILGNLVAEIFNDFVGAGTYSLTIDAARYNLSSGVYVYRIEADNFTGSKKMMLLK